VEGASYGAAALVALLPWMVAVQQGEGLPEYLRQRAALYQNWSGKDSPFRALLTLDPVHTLGRWNADVGLRSLLPTEANAVIWLRQVTLLIPLLLMAWIALDLWRSRTRAQPPSDDVWPAFLLAVLLVIVDETLLREPAYVVAIAPLTAAAGARLLTWNRPLGRPWAAVRAVTAAAIVVVTSAAALVFSQIIIEPLRLFPALRPAFAQLLASPPIDGIWPRDRIATYTRQDWDRGDRDKEAVMLRYLHDCTAPGDRVLVTGSTPSEVNYLVERPFAGGHVLWHHRWRSDPQHEAQSLAAIERQAVPFAYSDTDPVLRDFEAYPRIHRYLLDHYMELEGSGGLLLVDTRRTRVRTFGELGFPCFR
jgi:hypothetical protein